MQPNLATGQSSFRSRGQRLLLEHAVLILTALLLLGCVNIIYYFQQQQTKLVQTLVLQQARQYIKGLAEFRTLYTNKVVAVVRHQGIAVSHDIKNNPLAIPLPATLSMLLGSRITAEGAGSVRLFSPFPFPWRQQEGGLKDDFDRNAWQFFLSQTESSPFYKFTQSNGQPILRYAMADRMRHSCVHCHNSHPDTPKKSWKVGDVRGILEVSLPISAANEAARDSLQGAYVLSLSLIVLFVTGLSIVIRGLRNAVRDSQLVNLDMSKEVIERKKAEQQSRLHSEEIAKANLQLEEANRELMEFNYVASHDLQEPLRTLESYATLLVEDIGRELPADAEEDIHFIQAAAVRMRKLVQDLLTLSRTNTQEFKLELVDLNACMDEVKANLGSSLANTGGEIRWTSLPQVQGDTSQLIRVLQNLVGNGVKFHGSSPPVVEVTAEREEKAWRIFVKDNGIGIDPKFQEQIFISFKRLHGTSHYEGTGIGLAIVRKVVERHAGQVNLESTPGKGSCFWFTLPDRDS